MNLRDIEHIVEMGNSSELRELAQRITDEELRELEAQNRHLFDVISAIRAALRTPVPRKVPGRFKCGRRR